MKLWNIRPPVVSLMAIGTFLGGCGGDDPVEPTPTPPPAPTVASVTPSTGTVGTELKIVGSNFRAGATVLVGTIQSPTADLVQDTIFATVPSGVVADVTVSITVTNLDATSVVFPAAFTAVPPVLQFINSATKPSGNAGSTVIIEGESFGDSQGTAVVVFSDGAGGELTTTIASAADWTDTFIVTTVPSGVADGDVVVRTATGTSAALPFLITSNAIFSPSTINWSLTEPLPTAVSGHAAEFVPIDDASGVTVPYVHVIGGASNSDDPRVDVLVSVIQNDGSLSGWNTLTDLPEARAFHEVVAATPFSSKIQGNGALYVLGGIAVKDSQPVATVFRADLGVDGTIGAWSEETPLPVPLHSFGATIFRGAVYVAGGATTDNAPVATVYRARIDTLGNLSAWEELPSLPEVRAYHDFQTFGGVLYAVGGDSAAITPDDGNFTQNGSKLAGVMFSKINLRTGDLAAEGWTTTTDMQKARSKHNGLIAGGNLFVTSGLYAGGGNGSSENIFAQINSDGTIGSFGGATGSNTLQSVGGANLFNQAAISYIDANGVAHVVVLGGDDVNNAGTKRKTVIFY
ncbi:MAG: IPT/TIG domain-containing protein [Gemmatimonadetes bacterium]|nr:IPT/TIG domain-containing protein [Gemmatimonadota bacterium]